MKKWYDDAPMGILADLIVTLGGIFGAILVVLMVVLIAGALGFFFGGA